MEIWIKLAWLVLVFVHISPAVALFAPDLMVRMYGDSLTGNLNVLMVHRSAMFLAMVVATVFAFFDPASRRVVSVILAISMLSFLLVYVRAGLPEGPLRKIAWVDLLGLVPVTFVSIAAWGWLDRIRQ